MLVRVRSTCHKPVTNHESSPAQTLFSDIWPPFPKVAPKGASLSRNPSVERTFSLPSNPTACSSFLLPSYPLTALPGGVLTPTLSRRHADSSLSMSNTWPNKRDNSPYQQDTGPQRDKTGTTKGKIWRKNPSPSSYHQFVFFTHSVLFLSGDNLSSRYSPRPLRASLVSSSSTSSFRRALSSMRETPSISPVIPTAEQVQSHNNKRLTDRNLHLEPDDGISVVQDQQEEDSLDVEEVRGDVGRRSGNIHCQHSLRSTAVSRDSK